ncbi:MAG: L,D-transpeptidase family protein [Campylobacterota bacterium]|nr:L,D-transpeptidase family protein [Campylobacterota bacterium]
MRNIKFFFLLFTLVLSSVNAEVNTTKKHAIKIKPLKTELVPVSKTVFKHINLKTKKEKTIDLTGKSFIVVSVREAGSDGRFYAVDSDGTVWWSGIVTSGALEFRSPSGVFPIIQKKRYHMSTSYPDASGVNNMDYMMKFTSNGHALHKGSVNWMSHGCIHIDPKDVSVIFNWSTFKTKVIITRHSYMPFAKEDLQKIYLSN